MKKLLLAALIAYCVVYGFDVAALDTVHWHLDIDNLSGSASDFVISAIVFFIIGVVVASVLALLFATGIAVAICIMIAAAVSAVVGLGVSLVIPITVGALLYWLCRSKPTQAQHSTYP
ncbi:hypothetical protein [Alteromonas oceanisediminis]|uniref:hypothetical protein n=1 Tax=Alteromonas oceanisediminis TaxID=2836180 RepID=UPI001BD9FE7D|nr:hypothetical protein [Alteromonas oceanisediminis]MBT0585860.1 hypothetical protein [Alteromonas oceanisediminis]